MLELKQVNQSYGEKIVLENLNLKIEEGEFVTLMGSSGCGKSTILRYFTHLQTPTSGEVIAPEIIPMIFQERSCLEYLSVLDNVALPLIIKGVSKKEAQEKAMEMIKIVELEGHEKKYAKYPTLSGGQLQRVAVARSLVANPKVMLCDEPFGSLDSNTRRKMQDFISNLHKTTKCTIVMVTHDEKEAVILSDKIYILSPEIHGIKNVMDTKLITKDSANLFTAVKALEDLI